MHPLRLFPESASVEASQVDTLFLALLGLSLVFMVAVFGGILYAAIRYRHTNHRVDRTNAFEDSWPFEVSMIGGLTLLALGAFTWAANLYVDMKTPPPGTTLDVYGTAKQWMWKFEHPNGAREINALHVPVGQHVRLMLTSEDVIHSFFVPAFRVKQDVLPGRYTNVWFEATKPGRYRLFCAEYCGTDHSGMGGWVEVMEPGDYEHWLALGASGGSDADGGRADAPTASTDAVPLGPGPLAGASASGSASAARGAALFGSLNCASCHRADSTALYPARGPSLAGVYGRRVRLQNERTVLADDAYLRESILYPRAKLVQGYPAIMPSFRGIIGDADLASLVAYLRTLGADSLRAAPPPTPGAAPAARGPATAAQGAALFQSLGCTTCHRTDPTVSAPTLGPLLAGVYGRQVRLQDGRTVRADEAYLRESLLRPHAQLVQGYPAIMPSFRALASDDQIDALIAYLKSLGTSG